MLVTQSVAQVSDDELVLQVTGVAERRELLCAHLGLGSVSSKALQRQLNMFGFTLAQVEAGLAELQLQL